MASGWQTTWSRHSFPARRRTFLARPLRVLNFRLEGDPRSAGLMPAVRRGTDRLRLVKMCQPNLEFDHRAERRGKTGLRGRSSIRLWPPRCAVVCRR